MDFAMKDFESGALHSTTTATAAMGDAVNVQHKKPFDIADVDSNEMKLENDDWNIDTIFPLNNDFLNEFNDLADINMDANWADAYDYMSSPTTSTGTESENDHDMLGMKPMANQMLSPPQNLISSSSSDSGHSSDHVDFDINFDQLGTELLQQQPLLSSQTIPDVADNNLTITKTIKPEPITTTPKQQNVYKLIQSNTTKSVPFKTSASNVSAQKVQIVKKIAANVVQQIPDSKSNIKSVVSDNVTTNSPIVINKVNGNISGIRKVIQVKKGPNQKSIILPFSLKNGTDIRSIKIIKPSSLTKSPKILMAASNLLQEYKQNTIIVNKPVKVEPKYENDSTSDPSDCESYKFEEMFVQDDDDDDDDAQNDSDHDTATDHQSEYPKLILSGEEKRLLAKEGITLPAHYPLTKHEERELKRIRRKIRNKISAQDSRKRKKEYVDGLEERVKKCTDENQTLLKRIKLLQSQNQNLMNQMKKMQSLLTKGGNKSVQPATCLMVLLMSMALIAAPNLKMNKENNTDLMPSDITMDETQMQQNRRALLFDSREKFGDIVADEEIGTDFNLFNVKSENNEHNYADMPPLDGTSNQPIDNKIGVLIDTLDVDESVWVPPKNATPKIQPLSTMDTIIASPSIMQTDERMEEKAYISNSGASKNRSHLPSENAYQLNLEANGMPNIILSTEIDV